MDDMFGMLFSGLSPEHKFRTAVTSDMVDSVVKLIEEGGSDLVNAPLYSENQRTALHLACQKGYKGLIQILIKAGANVNAMDLFGFTPLTLALRSRQEECAQIILQNSFWHPDTIWQGEENISENKIPRWVNYSEGVLCLMVIGTPNLLAVDKFEHVQFSFFIGLCEQHQRLTKAFFLTGNQLPLGHVLQLSITAGDMGQWIKQMQSVQSLQHYARISIRRHFKTNVFFGASQLPLPKAMQTYLHFKDELPL